MLKQGVAGIDNIKVVSLIDALEVAGENRLFIEKTFFSGKDEEFSRRIIGEDSGGDELAGLELLGHFSEGVVSDVFFGEFPLNVVVESDDKGVRSDFLNFAFDEFADA
jgi:hypothetical protein